MKVFTFNRKKKKPTKIGSSPSFQRCIYWMTFYECSFYTDVFLARDYDRGGEMTGRRINGKAAAAAAKSRQSCPTLCDPIDGSPPGSPVPGILQARTLEWVAISFSNA